MRLSEHQYRSVSAIRGPLLFLEKVFAARLGELVRIESPDGRMLTGEVLKIFADQVLIQVFGGTQGLDTRRTTVSFSDAVMRAPLGSGTLGRVFDGSFRPRDGLPMFVPEFYDRWSVHRSTRWRVLIRSNSSKLASRPSMA